VRRFAIVALVQHCEQIVAQMNIDKKCAFLIELIAGPPDPR